jgi:putative FmdB family regulatory protein
MFYEFHCDECDFSFDQMQGMFEEHEADCPKCGGPARRVFNGQRFKIDWVNGGWHGDDINLGLGEHFESAAARDRFAAEHNLVKSPEL